MLFSQEERISLLLAFSFFLRIIFIFLYDISAPPVSWGDDFSYDHIAYQVVVNHSYENTWFPPGYPLFLALIYSIFDRNFAVVRLIQGFLGVVTCFITYLLGKKTFNEKTGLLAAFLLSCYPGHLYMSWRLMPEISYMLVVALSVLVAISLLEKQTNFFAVILGLLLGFSNLLKSNLIIFPVILIILIGIKLWPHKKKLVRLVVLLVTSFLLITLAGPIVNLIRFGQIVLLPTNAGHTLWWSNNPLANGYFIKGERHAEGRTFIKQYGFEEKLQEGNNIQRDKIYRQIAVLWILDNPKRFFLLCLKKLNNAFGFVPQSVVFEGNLLTRLGHILSFGFIFPFALGGIISSLYLRHLRQSCATYYSVLISYAVMVLIFYGTPRFTLIIIPYLLIFASYAILACYTWLSRSGNIRVNKLLP
jgi:4-amino-4-deoxy-L-arabinose transferase-like glycosyltransferase